MLCQVLKQTPWQNAPKRRLKTALSQKHVDRNAAGLSNKVREHIFLLDVPICEMEKMKKGLPVQRPILLIGKCGQERGRKPIVFLPSARS